MHSFIPSLSFLLSISTLALQLTFSGLPTANAAILSPLNHTAYPRGVGVAGHNSQRKRHADVLGSVHAQARSVGLRLSPGRRGPGADFTYFQTGMGACGNFNTPADFIVALNMQEFDTGNHCGAVITITANGKTAQATIEDRCVGCGPNNLDFTEGLYRFFDPTMNGVIHGSWEYGSGAPPPPPPPPPPKKPVDVPPPPPTTSQVQPPSTQAPSTTAVKTTSTTPLSSSTPAPTSASSAVVTSAPSSSSTTPTATASSATVQPTGNIANLFGAWLSMGGLVVNTVPSSA